MDSAADESQGNAKTKIESNLVEIMRNRLLTKNREHIMDELGISLSTWNKIIAGESIRSSVAHRLINRFENSNKQCNGG